MSPTISQRGMLDAARDMLVCLVVFTGLVVLAHYTTGCALFYGPTPTTSAEVLEHNYTTEVVACAATAGMPGDYDQAADMRCRAKVDCRYGVGPC